MNIDKLISPEYRDLITKKHDDRPWGGTGASWLPTLGPILAQYDPSPENPCIVLDYGCGRGTLKPALEKEMPFVMVDEYDPGVRGKDEVPNGQYDYVICTDVLEHVEEDKLEGVLGHIAKLSKFGCFLVIVYTPSKSSLPDGRNTHITQKPESWWRERLNKKFRDFHQHWIERGSGRSVLALTRVVHNGEA